MAILTERSHARDFARLRDTSATKRNARSNLPRQEIEWHIPR